MDRSERIAAIGALDDPVRRRLHAYVAAQDEPVRREDAAAAVGVSEHRARFHLDRLVEAGLLEVEFRRTTGRTGPGAGRPAKLYRRTAGEVAVSVPPRRYDLVAEVLAAAVRRSLAGTPLEEALRQEARRAGHRDGEGYAGRDAGSPELERAAGALADRGYEPVLGDRELVLGDCPFDRLAAEHTDLVCGINHDYVTGVLDGLACRESTACLEPGAGRCCVRVSHRE